MPYVSLQQMFDERWTEGHRNYWKSHYHRELSDGAIETLVDYCDSDAPFYPVFIEWLGGAISRPDAASTAFPHRDKALAFTVAMRWNEPERDDEHISWAREFHEAMAPYAADGVYMNYLIRNEEELLPEAYGDRYQRLRDLKTRWDSENLFRVYQNIKPED